MSNDDRILEKDLDQVKEHLGDPNNYLDEEITGSLLRVFLCDFWRVFFRMIFNHDDRGLPSKYLAPKTSVFRHFSFFEVAKKHLESKTENKSNIKRR